MWKFGCQENAVHLKMFCPKQVRNRFSRSGRAGVAVVELAVCLPVVVVILIGSIEACNAIYLKQTAVTAAYEAAKISTGTGGTKNAAIIRANEVLTARGLSSSTVTFLPADEADWNRGTLVTTQVNVSCENSLGGISLFYGGKSLTSEVVMVKQ